MTSILKNTFTAAAQLAKTVTLTGALTAATAFAQTTAFFPVPPPVVSTVPSNGDVNPYGVAFVAKNTLSDGALKPGDILVSNFNNVQNLQGTGTTVIRVDAHGKVSTFFQGKPGLGLTAALGVVNRGMVFVGNLPTADGTSATVQAGSLLVLDRHGRQLANLTDKNLIDGPWGMAIIDKGSVVQVFFSNVLNGTVTRLDILVSNDGDSLQVAHAYTIAKGFNHRLDPAALVLGPSGLLYNAQSDTLFVASSADNAIYAISDAASRNDASEGTGKVIYQDNVHLHGPIDLAMTPAGHLIVANSDGSNVDPNQPSELVEFTVDGKFVAQYSVDPNNGGAFGVGSMTSGSLIRFAAVDDNANTLSIWTEPIN